MGQWKFQAASSGGSVLDVLGGCRGGLTGYRPEFETINVGLNITGYVVKRATDPMNYSAY